MTDQRTTPIFRGSSGLHNALDPLRIPYSAEHGITALSAAANVIIDDSGMIQRRDGFTQLHEGSWHSLFNAGNFCLGVKDGVMNIIAEDNSITPIRSGFTSRVSYALVNGEVFYTSPSLYGKVVAAAHVDWEAMPYVGPDTNRSFVGPFTGSHVAFHAGRMWIASDSAAFMSEPFGWSYFDLHGGAVPLDSKVRMMAPVQDGMFISSDTGIYFLAGTNYDEFSLVQVTTYPALEWSLAQGLVSGTYLGLQDSRLCALWLSPKGICAGIPGGMVLNLSEENVIFPETAPIGASLIRGHNLVFTMGV